MRIIGGKYRGRRINPPKGFRARPTTDFARESLFNIIANRIDFGETEILDLFAGTGSISYEFASRGAKTVHTVEKDPGNVSFIKKTVSEMELGNIKAVHVDVRAFLKACTYEYDIIFADPPYNLPWLGELPDMIIRSHILRTNGFLILEHPGTFSFSSNSHFFEHRNYGSVNFSFFADNKLVTKKI